MKSPYRSLFIHNSLDGLREGLSHFSGPSRVALLLALAPGDPLHVIDPQQLLNGHEPRLEELYCSTAGWKTPHPALACLRSGDIIPAPDPGLTGLLAFGGTDPGHTFDIETVFAGCGHRLRYYRHPAGGINRDSLICSCGNLGIFHPALNGNQPETNRLHFVDFMEEIGHGPAFIRVAENT